MTPKRMTANPIRPARHRPGKAVEEASSSEEEEEVHEQPPQPSASAAQKSTRIESKLQNISLAERRAKAAAEEEARQEAERLAREKEEAEFETASSEEESEGESEEESSEEESSSGDEPKKLLRPTFVRKDQRTGPQATEITNVEEQSQAEDARRKALAQEYVQEQVDRQAAARAAGKKDWDDDEAPADEEAAVDDTDGLDPEAEKAAWKLRELKRIKRARDAIEAAEKEREEIEATRNKTAGEREAEDKAKIEKQKAEQEARGKAGYMQKYFHKGAFFQGDSAAVGLDQRDLMGSRYADEVNREILPEYMQIRDMAKLGRKGRSKYKDLKNEDTGRWGVDVRRGMGVRQSGGDGRFQPDQPDGERGRDGPSGANAMPVKQRSRVPEDAPSRPRGDRHTPDERQRGSMRSYSRSRSPPPRQRGESRDRRKRSASSDRGRLDSDKRRRISAG